MMDAFISNLTVDFVKNILPQKDVLIKINQLYKIFGHDPIKALDLVKNGMGKDELLEKSNCVLGLNNINLDINSSLMVQNINIGLYYNIYYKVIKDSVQNLKLL